MQWRSERTAAVVAALVGLCVVAMVPGETAASDWPQWRGPDRDDISPESSGWPQGWPPARLWARNVGKGSTSPVFVGGRLYVMGWVGPSRGGAGTDTLYCLDARTGSELWKQSYPCRYQSRIATGDEGAYGGPCSTPTVDLSSGFLYSLSIDGDLRCWDTSQQGKLVWSKNFHDEYKVPQRPDVGRGKRDYGFMSAPLIRGDLVIVEVGDDDGTVMAFDKKTGQRRWRSAFKDFGGHSSGPVELTVQGVPCLANLALRKLVVLRLDAGHEGETIAEFPWTTDFANNIATPAVSGSQVVITSNYNQSETCLLDISLRGAREKWRTRDHSKVSSPVIYKGSIYMADGSFKCLDLATGRTKWSGGVFGHGSCLVTTGDDKVIAFGNRRLVLLEATPPRDEYRQLSQVERVVSDTCYPHVTLSDGLICCKDRAGNMVVFSVRPEDRKRAGVPQAPTVGPSASVDTPGAAALHDGPAPDMAATWPGNRDGLVFAWADGTSQDGARTSALRARGNARISDEGAMELGAGAFLAEDADQALLDACRQTGQLSIEALITPKDVNQTGPARIISFSSDPYRRNVTIGQERDRLILRLRTPRTGENGMSPEVALCRVTAGKPHHVVVSYAPGRLTCYLDGRRVLDTDAVQGDFSNWSEHHLLFGDEWEGSRLWSGRLEGVAIHSRVIGAEEAARRYALALQRMRK